MGEQGGHSDAKRYPFILMEDPDRYSEALSRRFAKAWEVARTAAALLKLRFGATRVVVFGSLTTAPGSPDGLILTWQHGASVTPCSGRQWEQLPPAQVMTRISIVQPSIYTTSIPGRIFTLIASSIDQAKPEGETWQHDLLRNMFVEITGVRPVVLSRVTTEKLDPYCGFYHVVNNVYSFFLSPDRMAPLVANLPDVYAQTKADVQAFTSALEQHALDTS